LTVDFEINLHITSFCSLFLSAMGLMISNVFNRLFGKRQMRILMGKTFFDIPASAVNVFG
jgi:hypothetical protein